jgi:uncharacterized protein with WD repeat
VPAAADVQMFWHPQGTYLAVQVDRFTKTKKSIYTSFELFSLKVLPFTALLCLVSSGPNPVICLS